MTNNEEELELENQQEEIEEKENIENPTEIAEELEPGEMVEISGEHVIKESEEFQAEVDEVNIKEIEGAEDKIKKTLEDSRVIMNELDKELENSNVLDEAKTMMEDLSKWSLDWKNITLFSVGGIGPDLKKLHFSNPEIDKYMAYVRKLDRMKDSIEEFALNFVPIVGGLMDMGAAVTGETHGGRKLEKTSERVTMFIVGLGCVAFDAATLGTSALVEGAGKVVVKEGTEALAKTAAKEGAEALAKTAVKEGAEAAAKEGVEATAKYVIGETGENMSKYVLENGSEYLMKNGGEAGMKLAEQMQKLNALLDKSPVLRKIVDEKYYKIIKNRKSMANFSQKDAKELFAKINEAIKENEELTKQEQAENK